MKVKIILKPKATYLGINVGDVYEVHTKKLPDKIYLSVRYLVKLPGIGLVNIPEECAEELEE
jgi:hypothetical protein